MIALEGASKRFGAAAALAPTTLAVGARRRLALIGASGSGKSTVLRLVIGLVAPDTGTVTVLDTPVTPATAPGLRRKMGYVIQDGGLFPHLTARDNASLAARRFGWTRDRIDARIDELAKLVRLDAAQLDRYPAELSGGQRQRVGLMRALMLDPEVLLLDEPLGALDPMVRAALQEDLKRVFSALEKTVLLVTHDMAEAAYLADEIALLHEGRLLQRGTVSELWERPAEPFVRAFLSAQRATWWTA